MKKRLIIAFIVISTFFVNTSVNALCVDKNVDTKDIDFYYEFDGLLAPNMSFYTSFLPDNIRVELIDKNGSKIINDLSQNLAYNCLYYHLGQVEDFADGVTLTLNLYSNECSDEAIYSKTLSTEKYNVYYKEDVCIDYPETDLCQPFVDVSKYTSDEFQDEVVQEAKVMQKKAQNEKKVKEAKKTFVDVFSKNYIYFTIPFLIVSLFVMVYILIFRRRGKDETD